MSSQDFIDSYVALLIVQYASKAKARGEITTFSTLLSKVFLVADEFKVRFDLDTARANELDLIGKIVGISRNVPDIVPKITFGFEGDPNSRTFADLSNPNVLSAPFFDQNEPEYDDLELNDHDYRFFIRAKIAVNATFDTMVSDDQPNSIVDQIGKLFEGFAYVTDLFDMSLLLQVSYQFDMIKLELIQKLNLLPRPQAVQYHIIQVDLDNTFGFEGDATAKPFGDLDDPAVGGVFASTVS